MPAKAQKKWSAEVTEHSDALDLENDIFKSRSPRQIALSLKRSAQRSKRRKATPYQSAMSMLTFYINRAGRNLSPGRKRLLERSKDQLRLLFGRKPAEPRRSTRPRGRPVQPHSRSRKSA